MNSVYKLLNLESLGLTFLSINNMSIEVPDRSSEWLLISLLIGFNGQEGNNLVWNEWREETPVPVLKR